MSKTELKKQLQSLLKEQAIEQVPELSGNCKSARGYSVFELFRGEKQPKVLLKPFRGLKPPKGLDPPRQWLLPRWWL